VEAIGGVFGRFVILGGGLLYIICNRGCMGLYGVIIYSNKLFSLF